MRSLSAADPEIKSTFAIFDAYLDGPADHPVGVAVSGGGDSVALLYALAQWGRRPLHVFCVDHGINLASAVWTDGVSAHARAVGAQFTALNWIGEKPSSGLSAAARAARHALLANAARQNGIRVLCLAHTADDLAEAEIMRREGSNVGSPQVWSPAPVWPDGRGVFLFRPFLNLRRVALRDRLRVEGVHWIDDPGNEDRASLRVRARRALAGQAIAPAAVSVGRRVDMSALLRDEDTLGGLGMIVFDRKFFQASPDALARRWLATAVVCAGGDNRLPRGESLDILRASLASENALTLCGARVQRCGERIEFVREAGDMDRSQRPDLQLPPGIERVWDGRFGLRSDIPATVRSSGQVRAELDESSRAALLALPVALRTVLPVLERAADDKSKQKKLLLANPSLTQSPYKGIFCLSWVLYRFRAASGAYACESALVTALEKAR